MKLFSRILPMLVLTSTAFAVSAQAATLTIQDEQAPHAPILRYESFLATLVATVRDEPKSNDEITVTGPTFEWKGGGDGLTVQPSGTDRTQIDSGNSPRYGTIEGLKEDGYKKAQVTCVATYSRKKKNGEVLTPVNVSGALTIDFFVRVPKKVYSTGKVADKIVSQYDDGKPWILFSPWSPRTEEHGGKFYEFDYYGAGDIYDMELTDNRNGYYPYGVVYEEFDKVYPEGAKPDGDRGGSSWIPPTWTDQIRKVLDRFETPNEGPSILLSFDQYWKLRENGEIVPLNTHHLEVSAAGTTRSY